MTLRDDLKNYIPTYLWETMNHPEGYKMTAEEFNSLWNRIQVQGDTHANLIRDILLMLYGTVLSDTNATPHINATHATFTGSTLAQILNDIAARILSNAQNMVNHKISSDHDSRYFTQAQLLGNILTDLYYTKEDLLPYLRNGDTLIREEVFTIVTANNGDGTFTYNNGITNIVGQLGTSGEQIFELTQGVYTPGQNRVEAIINDTLRRSVTSGGLQEIDGTHVALTTPEGETAEITIRYYERLGAAAEYNIRLSPTQPPQLDGKTMWFEELS